MRITVVNGTEKRGVTHALKETFLEELRDMAQVTEFWLPRDCAGFCCGSASCILNGEQTCKDAEQVSRIAAALREADLIVMTSPAYVMHVTGGMKAFLDHMAYMWMPHRPAPEMFSKRAVVITQCLGAGGASTAKDIKDSLSWWGVSKVEVVTGRVMSGIVWDELPEKTRSRLAGRVRRLAGRMAREDYSRPARASLATRLKFLMCRQMRKGLSDAGTPDYEHWASQGWLEEARPWKNV